MIKNMIVVDVCDETETPIGIVLVPMSEEGQWGLFDGEIESQESSDNALSVSIGYYGEPHFVGDLQEIATMLEAYNTITHAARH